MPRRPKTPFKLYEPDDCDKEITILGPAREDQLIINIDYDDRCSDFALIAARRIVEILNEQWESYGPLPDSADSNEDDE